MMRFHTSIAIIIGIITTLILIYIDFYVNLTMIAFLFSICVGGMIATGIAIKNKARIGLYEGFGVAILFLIWTAIVGIDVPYIAGNIIIGALIGLPFFAGIGGFIAKKCREYAIKNSTRG